MAPVGGAVQADAYKSSYDIIAVDTNTIAKTVTVTAAPKPLTTPIKLGDYVQMGTYDTDGDGTAEPILWRCVAFEKISGYDEDGNPITDSTDTVTEYQDGYLPLMLADKSICTKEFDAAGSVTSGSHGRDYSPGRRQTDGSNYWGDSNIRDWLNSSESAGNVVWTCGNSPSYKNEAGFLTNFTDAEKTAIKRVTQKSLLSNYDYDEERNTVAGASTYHTYDGNIDRAVQNYTTAYAENITDTMFLLDVQQVYNVYENDNSLDNTGYYKLSVNVNYWLRSPFSSNSIIARCVYSNGFVGGENACVNSFGVRPAFYLKHAVIFTSGDGTSENPYSGIETAISDIADQTYTGREIEPDITIKNGETTLVEYTDYTVTYSNNINAGTATVTITGIGNYTGTVITSFTINKADISPVVSMDGWTYGETANEPSVSGNTGDGAVTYQYKVSGADDSDYSDTVPSNAGTYTVKATVAETDNYNGGTATRNFTISKSGVIAPTINSKIYTGETLTADVAASDIYSVSANDGGVNVGEYDVVLTLTDSNNYTWQDSEGAAKTLTFNITQATNAWTTEPSVSDVTYGTAINPQSAAKFGDVSVTYVGTGGTSYEESATAPTAAGSYTAKFSVAGTNNYTALSQDVNFTIGKADSQTEVKDNQTVTYGETLTLTANVSKSAINSLSLFSVAADTVEFYVDDTSLGTADVTYDDDTAKDSGTATLTINTVEKQLVIGDNTITAVYGGSVNLNGSDSITVTLNQKQVGLTWSGYENLVYDGTAKSVTATATGIENGDSVTVTVTGGAETDAGTYTATATGLTGTGAEYYALPETATQTYTINQTTPDYTIPTGLTAIISKTLESVALPDGWNWSDSSASVGAIGNNEFTAVFTPDDTVNYNSITETLTVTVGYATAETEIKCGESVI